MSGAVNPTLNLDLIVETALQISERDGFEAVSMRRVANVLGVTAMGLYVHVADKRELLDHMADRYLVGLDLAEDAVDWQSRLTRIFRSLHHLMLERPVLGHVFATQPLDGNAAHVVAEAVLGTLRDNGFDDRLAVELSVILSSFTAGYSTSQQVHPVSGDGPNERVERVRDLTGFPNLTAVAEHYVRWPSSDAFERGLRLLIDSFGRLLHDGHPEAAAPAPPKIMETP